MPGVDRRTLLAGALATGLVGKAGAQTPPPMARSSRSLVRPDPSHSIDLWPGRPPGAPSVLPVEQVVERSEDPAFNDRFVAGIAVPRMAVFRPERPDGSAALITPGGGYERVVIDKEGYELARLLSARGTTAFVLFYRLPHEGWSDGADVPLSDAQRAMRLIRHRSREYGVNPARVCAIGFSAGGHLCADLMTRYDRPVYAPVDAADALSARPDAAAPIYPVVSMSAPDAHAGSRARLIGRDASPERERAYSPHLNVREGGPPVFLLHAEDDGAVPVSNTLLLRTALKAKRVPVETHLFPDGGHGFGLRLSEGHSVEGWENLLLAWGKRQRIFA